MREGFTILIADRNPHVRELLKREMIAEGYKVRLAENGRDVLKWSYDSSPLDLLILDPDLPDIDESALFARLADRIPALPMVIHTFFSDFDVPSSTSGTVAYVEKGGSSIENLKQVVTKFLNKADLAIFQRKQNRVKI
ncbi:MAG: response regulator [Deltaproteobacteria bacterium]|nr:response regulator [Deltaproteobacteria bacterium]MBW1960036.1 response regulator [Deltaproteobacteria bacterium]MBW1995762.1 response regulator [Deltaproteobacteria bacterium]MBW2151228.1 response regulator [Deltaproteobacteria bacterium]